MEYSFYDWCIDNERNDLLDRWDYKLNNFYPNDISYRSGKYVYLMCNHDDTHFSEKFRIDHITNNITKTECKQCNSFYQWCLNNNHQDFIDAWDVNLNKDDIHYVPHASGKKYFFKIENGMPSISYRLADITSIKFLSPIKKFYNSLGYYLISTFGEDAIEKYWSDKNNKLPWDYDKGSGKKVWFKCQEKDYHKDYCTPVYNFVNGSRCPYCASKKVHPLDSFAQYNINRLGEEFLEKYWCDDNVVDPWEIAPFSNNIKVKIQCQHVLYHQYEVTAADFSLGVDCSFCNRTRVHYLDSLGYLFPEIIDVWSDKNKKTPFEYKPYSHELVWLKCENGIHDDYRRRIADFTLKGFKKCHKCVQAEKESSIQKSVRLFLETMPYKLLHEYDCSIIPINPNTNMKMPFDNEVCDINGINLIVETHGIQHYEINGWHITQAKHSGKTPQEEFEYQKWKDEYKKQYALSHDYEYLEIPYYTVEDGSYKELIIYKINTIKHITI